MHGSNHLKRKSRSLHAFTNYSNGAAVAATTHTIHIEHLHVVLPHSAFCNDCNMILVALRFVKDVLAWKVALGLITLIDSLIHQF
jgi:hypothetical protein